MGFFASDRTYSPWRRVLLWLRALLPSGRWRWQQSIWYVVDWWCHNVGKSTVMKDLIEVSRSRRSALAYAIVVCSTPPQARGIVNDASTRGRVLLCIDPPALAAAIPAAGMSSRQGGIKSVPVRQFDHVVRVSSCRICIKYPLSSD